MKDAAILLLCAVALAQGLNQSPDLRRPCNCDPSEAQQICQANYDNDGVLIAHENCDQFYKCANGQPVAYFCPSNLLYDPFSETCEWPDSVDCGNRPISDGPSKEEDDGSDDVSDVDNDGTCNCNPGEAPSICAAEGSNGILVAHQNCNQFYKCAEGRPVTFDCPPTLLYNPYKEECDWAYNVECGDRVIPDPKEDESTDDDGSTENDGTCNCNPEEAPAICAAPGSESELIAHENCNKYYICNHGLPVAVSCFGDLLFNPYTRECDWPRNVDCGDRLVPETECTGCNDNASNDASCDDNDSVSTPRVTNPGVTTPGVTNPGVTNPGVTNPADTTPGNNCDPSEAPTICAEDDSEGVLVAHENCNKFYKCSGGKPVAVLCPPNLLFNPAKDQCDWPANVDCGDRVMPDPESDEIRPPGDDVVVPTRPPGTCNCNPGEAPSICATGDSDGVLVAHENCNQFYKCDHGKPVVLYCYGNLLYNPYTEQCDWPENVECGDRVIPDPDNSVSTPGATNPGVTNPGVTNPADTTPGNNCDPSEAPAICAQGDSEGILVAHEKCNKFYKCSGGKPVALLCPPNLLFNPNKDQCDWPFNVDCGDRVMPDPESDETRPPGDDVVVPTRPPGTCNCNPGEAPSICATGDSDGVLVAHENCNQFYKCDHGKPVVLYCYGDLLYNPYTEQCDWPENVDCGDRVIPDNSVSTPGVTNPGVTNPDVTNPPDTAPGNNCDPSEAPSICAEDDSEGVLVAHEKCNKFYKCSGGKPVALLCPPNLLFNPAKDQCDWPENVDCGDRVMPDPESDEIRPPGDDIVVPTRPPGTCNCNPGEAPSICATGDSDGVLVAHENCNQFYKCDHGKPVVLYCYGDLLYNPYTEQCDWPENVDCGDRVIPDNSVSTPGVTNPGVTNPGVTNPPDTTPGNNCDPSEAPAICAQGDSEGILVAHEKCNKFYKCSGGKPVALLCPPNLLFNPNKDQCDWPFNVDCGDRVMPDPESDETRPPGDDVVVPTRPPGTCNCNPGEAPSICATGDSDGVLVAHENCNQFYKCDHGKPVVLYCYGDLLYNPYTEQCDWPENVDCEDRVIPDNSVSTPGVINPGVTNPGVTNPPDTAPGNNCDPSEAPSICAEDDSEGVLVAHENCNKFYKCSGGKPVALLCPPNLLFNPAKDQCDWPQNVDCGDRVIPGPDDSVSTPGVTNPGVTNPADTTPGNNCDPSEAPAICAQDDSEGILVAHENCNKFYKCSGGKPVALLCPPNLLFNPNKDQCDWPFNVDCGDRVMPDPESDETRPPGDDVVVPTRPPGTCNCNPGEAPSICATGDSDGVLVAHENCNQFYKCDHGKPVVLYCYGDLLYNPYTEQCDWPENVDCEDRVIPDNSVSTPGVINPGVTNPGVTNPPDTAPGNNCDPSEAPSICAEDDSEGVLVAHENCNKFYKCSGGKPVALLCPPNLLFNPAKDQCDWPQNVDCGDRVIPGPDDSVSTPGVTNPGVTNPADTTPGNNCDPSEAPAICAQDDSEGILVAHENCNKFYKCSGGKPVALLCPPNLLFNPAKDQCDWPENVDCGDRVIPGPDDSVSTPGVTNPGVTNPADTTPGNNCDPSEAPAICAQDDSEGILVAHENCNKFYKCSGGKPVALLCPPNLLFNPAKDQCDWAENVDCGDRVMPDPESDETRPPGDDVVVPTRPPGTCNCNPGEAPSICATGDSDGVLVAHENCNQFYKCDHGKPVVLYCYGDLLYNPYTEQCDWPENVDCGDRVIPDNSVSTPGVTNPGVTNPGVTNPPDTAPGNNCDPSEAPTICAEDDSEGVLVAHENCNKFYKCSGGKPVALLCPPNLLFNPAKDQCDWPENVDCGDRVIPGPDDSVSTPGVTNPGVTNPADTTPGNNCDPSEAPAICAQGDSEGILVAHENCNKFYKCSGGKPVALLCPPNLLFNPAKDQCDWPENVDCGDRVMPDPESDETRPPGDDVVVPTRPPGTCNCNPGEAPSICATGDSDGVLVAHEHCNQFYKCDHGKPVVLYCYGDLLYNPYTEQCDWPENVDCGDRVIPDNSVSTPGVTNPGVTNPGVTNPPDTTPGNNCDPSEAPTICAEDDSEGVLVAHENCNKFYKCSGGKPVALLCPPNLLFNPAKDQCDWPENVDCGDRVIPGPDDSVSTPGVTNPGVTNPGVTNPPDTAPGNNCDPSEAPTICAEDDSEGVLVAHENCNKFYKCSGGKPVALLCPPNLLFNPAKDQCDWPENVDCGDRVMPDPDDSDSDTSEIRPDDDVPAQPPVIDINEDCSGISDENGGPCNCDPDQAPSICAVDNSNGILIAHENCNQFYQCDNGRPIPFKCPMNTFYNPDTQRCDWAFNVECGDRIIPDPEENVTSESNEDDSKEEEPIVGPCNCNPEEAPAICAAEGSSGVQIAHENCNQFYLCDHGRPVAFTCSGFLLYNPYTERCDWPEYVECGDRMIPEPGSESDENDSNEDNISNPNDDPSQAPAICAGDGSEGVLVAHENCDQYYICSGGVPVSRPCNDGLFYNPYNQRCDWPSNVVCGDRIVPDDCACNPRNAPALCVKPGSQGKLVAHENCNQFYICSNSVPVPQTCPASLLYNPDKEICDWPQNVNCENRLLSHASFNKHWQSRQILRN